MGLEERLLRNLDYALIIAVVVAILFGLVAVFTATYESASADGGDGLGYVKRQLVAIALGLVGSLVILSIDYRQLDRLAALLYVGSLAFLASVFVLGVSRSGAQAWLRLGPLSIQPSEYAKIGVAMALASHLSRKDDLSTLASLVPSFLLVGIPMGIVVLQNDLGTALVFGPMLFAMLYVAGARTEHLLGILFVVGAVVVPVGFQFFLKEYQRQRLLIFLNPYSDPTGNGYNVIQSMIAIGSGKLFGKGLLNGTQGQLNFLPEHHTDFIFSVIAEELGFIGAFALLAVLGFILWRGYRIAASAKDRYGMLLAVGITSMMAFHILVNVGMAMGVMPVTGIPLPFVSYGGSSIMAYMFGIALLLNVYMRRQSMLF